MRVNVYRDIYLPLWQAHGPQGWWPLLSLADKRMMDQGRYTGYHSGCYDFPRTEEERFEICVGAILTQNTAWINVEKALRKLSESALLTPSAIFEAPHEQLSDLIRPSGYYNVKSRKLREFSSFFQRLQGHEPSREQLLSVWGVGEETADSILLYAYKKTEMVVDAYTKRILASFGLVDPGMKYQEVKTICQCDLPRDLAVYQEFHALMVAEGKNSSMA